MTKKILAIGLACIALSSFGLTVGKKAPTVELSGKVGGMVDGTSFSTTNTIGKVATFFYVDPDEKKVNMEFEDRLKELAFSRDYYQPYAIINVAASKMPGFLVAYALKGKQKKFPDTIYIKDNKKVFVESWGLTDNSYDIVIADSKGVVLFAKSGKLSKDEMDSAIKIIKEQMKLMGDKK
ncbi:MAG: transcriptional regulator [Kiritimatiellae bacterium]|jgi:predicted transcriptional regulator|nr:transcriptional regulator [Kiritimatiellia bacterium]